MSTPEPSRVFEAFDRVRALPKEDRDLALESDSTLGPEDRATVRELLAHDSPTEEFRGEPVGRASARLVSIAEGASTPERIGPYAIIRVLGRGGFGTVFLAREDHPPRLVALKVMRPLCSPAQARRMEFEAEALARLAHPGIARVHACGLATELGGAPYIAMEFIEGIPIDAYVRDTHPPVAARLTLIARLCRAVAYAHHHGILHRDIAPKNILVDSSGSPHVLDFGLARALDSEPGRSTDLTIDGTLVGTMRYMSPEQLAGDRSRIDTRSDVFALGLVAFEAITGRHPYVRDESRSITEVVRDLSERPCLRPSAVARALRGDLELVLRKAVERDPSARYQSASALAEDLERVAARRPVAAHAPSISYLARRFADRHRPLVLGALAAIALIIGVAINMVLSMRRENTARASAITALDAVISRVLSPLAPRLGTLADREALLREIGPNIEWIARVAPKDSAVTRIQARYFGALSDVDRERFDYPSALGNQAIAVERYSRLWNEAPTDVPTGHEFSIAIVKLGDLNAASGDTDGAFSRYEQALRLDESLVALAPQDIGALSNLFWSYSRFEGHAIPGDLAEAAKWRDRERRIAERMMAIDSNDWRTLESCAEAQGRLAMFEPDPNAALERALQALDFAHRLVTLDPSIRRHQANLLVKCYTTLQLALDADRVAVAREALSLADQTAAELRRDAADSETEAAYLAPLELARRNVALTEGNLPEAAAHGVAYLEIIDGVLARQPHDQRAVTGKGDTLVLLCRTLLELGLMDECADRLAQLEAYSADIAARWGANDEVAALVRSWRSRADQYQSVLNSGAAQHDPQSAGPEDGE